MKILIYRYNSICEPDVMWALDFLGIEHDEITLEVTNKDTTPQETMKAVGEALDTGNYHAVFSINYYPILSEVCRIYKVRYISWTVDSPVLELYSTTLANEWNRTFIFDRADYEAFKPIGGSHIFHLPLAANVRRVREYLDRTGPDRKLGGDIALVGSLYTEKNPYDKLTIKDEYMRGYLDAAIEAQSRLYGAFILGDILNDDIISKIKADNPGCLSAPEGFVTDDIMSMALNYLSPAVAVTERRRLLTLLGERFRVNLYTGSDSRGIPVKNRGLVTSMTQMPLVFRDAKINLNFTLKSIRTGIPQRVFDVLSCGGFLLTNYQEEIAQLLPDCLVMFGGDEDLLSAADYYLTHERQRQEIARAGFAQVEKCHRIEQRVADMLEEAFSV